MQKYLSRDRDWKIDEDKTSTMVSYRSRPIGGMIYACSERLSDLAIVAEDSRSVLLSLKPCSMPQQLPPRMCSAGQSTSSKDPAIGPTPKTSCFPNTAAPVLIQWDPVFSSMSKAWVVSLALQNVQGHEWRRQSGGCMSVGQQN
jgi:hypothetical protein